MRAELGLLTSADCQLIAEQLAALGRSLAPHGDIRQATRLGEETAQLMRLTQEDDDLQECLHALHAVSGKKSWQTYLQFFLSLSSRTTRPH